MVYKTSHQKGAVVSFWLDMLGILFTVFGLGLTILNPGKLLYLGDLVFPATNGLIFALFGVALLIINYLFHPKKLNQEEQTIEKEIGDDRMHLFYYSTLFLGFLLFVAGIYISLNYADLISSPEEKLNWLQRIFIAIWFAMLGTIAISFKGLSDHSKDWDTFTWGIWYIERPFNGLIIGVMTYIILQILNTKVEPSLLSLIAVSFIFGLQERRFFDILNKVAELLLTTQLKAPPAEDENENNPKPKGNAPGEK